MRTPVCLLSLSLVCGGQSLFKPDLMTQPKVAAALKSIDTNEAQTIRDWIALTEIPAPSKEEQKRAAWLKQEMQKAGLTDVQSDEMGNTWAVRKGSGSGPQIVFAAHLDTVVPAGTPIKVMREGNTLRAPGIGDDSSGIVGTLAMFRALQEAGIQTKGDLVFLATVQEEAGFLGMTHWLKNRAPAPDMLIAVDLSMEQIWYGALHATGFRFVYTSPGGHTLASRGKSNPVKAVARAIQDLYMVPLPETPATKDTGLPVYNVGMMGGGPVSNAIPREAFFSVDVRAQDAAMLAKLEATIQPIAEGAASKEGVGFKMERRSFSPPDSTKTIPEERRRNLPLVRTAEAIANHLKIAGENAVKPLDMGSTDANVAVGAGIPAVAIGVASAKGAHTPDETADATSLARGVRYLLLVAVSLGGL